MFLKELKNEDYFIFQQDYKNKKIYSIRSNYNCRFILKEYYKTLKEAKAVFKKIFPDRVCYYHHVVFNKQSQGFKPKTDILTLEIEGE